MTTEKQKILLNYLCQNDSSIVELYLETLSEAFTAGMKQGITIAYIIR